MKYQEAKAIALGLNDRVNACNEYKAGYHFYQKRDYEVTGDNGMVVLKDNGRAITWMAFIMDYHPETVPVELEFEKGGILKDEKEQ